MIYNFFFRFKNFTNQWGCDINCNLILLVVPGGGGLTDEQRANSLSKSIGQVCWPIILKFRPKEGLIAFLLFLMSDSLVSNYIDATQNAIHMHSVLLGSIDFEFCFGNSQLQYWPRELCLLGWLLRTEFMTSDHVIPADRESHPR